MTAYDDNNIFARLLRGEIPSKKLYENDQAIVINDINPMTPIHVLVIAKGKYISFVDFSAKASDAEIAGYVRAISEATRISGAEKDGYRLIFNIGPNSHSEVPHLHAHILGGRSLGSKLVKDAE